MNKKMKVYSAEFKAKIVIELLGCDITLNELASKFLKYKVSNVKQIDIH